MDKVRRKLRFYPWDIWLAKDQFKLVRGKHFTVTILGLLQALYKACARMGVRVSVRNINDQELIVRVVERGREKVKPKVYKKKSNPKETS